MAREARGHIAGRNIFQTSRCSTRLDLLIGERPHPVQSATTPSTHPPASSIDPTRSRWIANQSANGNRSLRYQTSSFSSTPSISGLVRCANRSVTLPFSVHLRFVSRMIHDQDSFYGTGDYSSGKEKRASSST